jgi:hypothetical protein
MMSRALKSDLPPAAKIDLHPLFFIFLTYMKACKRQWDAVRTHLDEMREPPQDPLAKYKK